MLTRIELAARGAGNASGPTTNTCSPGEPERFPTRDQDAQPLTCLQERAHDGRRGEYVLEVVENQEHVLVVDEPLEPRSSGGSSAIGATPSASCHGGRDEIRCLRRRQRNEPRAPSAWSASSRPRHLEREARLADSAGSYEREQAPPRRSSLTRARSSSRPTVSVRGSGTLNRVAGEPVGHGEPRWRGWSRGLPQRGRDALRARAVGRGSSPKDSALVTVQVDGIWHRARSVRHEPERTDDPGPAASRSPPGSVS